jgi:tetratricopeptide (TPR) repeat protein
VEAVIDSTPEEAYYMLDSIDPTTLHGEALALYALLCTQADYQCYVPLTSDSLIRLATDYYDNSSPHHRAALAHYYLGCTYTELGDDAEALRAYMQALTLFPDTTVRHYALCYQNMARHYRNRNMLPESLAAFTAFRNIMQQRGSATDVFNADYQIAVTYLYMELFDEAASRLQALLTNAEVPQRIADEAAFQLAKIACYHTEEYAMAMHYIDRHIASVHDVRRLGPDYSVKGDIYAALGHADSARHYYHLSLLPRRDVYADCNTYYKLIEIALAEGCTDSISSYIEHHPTLLGSIARMQSRAEVDRVHAEHDMLMYDRTMRERHIRFVLIGVAIVVALALALLALFVILDNRRKSTYIRLQKQLAQNRAEMLTLTATSDDSDTSSTTPDSERLYALRCQRIEYCRQLFAHTEWQTRISQIEHTPEALLALTLSERNALQQVLVDTFADAMIDFKNECPSLTSSDLQLLIFTLLGCSIRTISICTAISENALRSRKTRMKAKMSEQMYLFVFG